MCFVGRLAKETTAKDMKAFLVARGIPDAQCSKLQAKEGTIYSTGALKVICRSEFKEKFYNEAYWPAGCSLPDWHVRSRYSSNYHGDRQL